jgi:hypothetical protein
MIQIENHLGHFFELQGVNQYSVKTILRPYVKWQEWDEKIFERELPEIAEWQIDFLMDWLENPEYDFIKKVQWHNFPLTFMKVKRAKVPILKIIYTISETQRSCWEMKWNPKNREVFLKQLKQVKLTYLNLN